MCPKWQKNCLSFLSSFGCIVCKANDIHGTIAHVVATAAAAASTTAWGSGGTRRCANILSQPYTTGRVLQETLV